MKQVKEMHDAKIQERKKTHALASAAVIKNLEKKHFIDLFQLSKDVNDKKKVLEVAMQKEHKSLIFGAQQHMRLKNEIFEEERKTLKADQEKKIRAIENELATKKKDFDNEMSRMKSEKKNTKKNWRRKVQLLVNLRNKWRLKPRHTKK